MQGVEGLAQGLQMAAVRDDGIAVVDASGVESRAESGKEPFDSFAGFAEMKECRGLPTILYIRSRSRRIPSIR